MLSRLEFAITAARQAGAILRDFYFRPNLQVELKQDRTLLTEADLASNEHLLRAIQDAFPGDECLSEEQLPAGLLPGGHGNPANPAWIIDPLDGTSNFSLGLPTWGVLLARLVDGLPELAVLYFPILGELYMAEKGHGAWLLRENPARPDQDAGEPTRLVVQSPDRTRPLSVFACCSRTFRRYQVNVPYRPRILGCAAYSFCLLGRGAALLAFECTPKLWDLAGAWLLVQEAGGVIASIETAQPFPFLSKENLQASFPTLAAPDHELFARAQAWIQPKA
jgi:myo-inositol-1(or 4)-monophosphatase